ncbi:Cellulase [Syntrophobotulus glycolicus DSM 8271]|uniref:Cellulase n=1 Tax=Syntrophobotulus glycolicus (strain DSM 8271 / FlGlyR) TaxID=645991 RepID=F0SZJ3_SYNGF|nr:M42 family metallopeptidase [Syntrophobotulus glycolicus]ADY56079.1 Cellulase [Syntrophobotulus glycolicus DSM 8271]
MLLKELCSLSGVSGDETAVRNYLQDYLKDVVDSLSVDKMGNLIAVKNGTSTSAPTILLSAHMDEVGFMITDITADGYLKFEPIGGIDERILISKPVLINRKTYGVIGIKAIHLQKMDERRKVFTSEQLYIDIGAGSKEDAEKAVSLGDYACFASDYFDHEDSISAKSLDDRAGCSIIARILQDRYDCTIMAVFTVQEEIGLRGSKVISNWVKADLALLLESTGAADFLSIEEEDWVVSLGKGPALSIMDQTTIYDRGLFHHLIKTAEHHAIPYQIRQGTQAGNDSGNIHLAGEGIRTMAVSIPCRYIHAANSMINKNDYENCYALIHQFLQNIKNNNWEESECAKKSL